MLARPPGCLDAPSVQLRRDGGHRHALAGELLNEFGAGPRVCIGQTFALWEATATDGHNRQLPRLTGGPFRYKTYAAEFTEKAMKMATKPLKQAVIAAA